jgi:hypothetical protein
MARGSNQKGLMIFYNAPEETHQEIIDFLEKILKAIQLDLQQDTLFINMMPDRPLKITDLLKKNDSHQMLLFGIPPSSLGIQFPLPLYLNIEHQGVHYLAADPLPAIFTERQAGGKTMSGKLWKAIKQFALS